MKQKIVVLFVSLFLHSIAMGQLKSVAIVIDGDRIVLSDGTRLSLLGVDAPEKHPSLKLTRDAAQWGKSEKAVIQLGERAAEYLTLIAGGRAVRIGAMADANAEGFIPAMVYVLDRKGVPAYALNMKMIEAGYASVDLSKEHDDRSQLLTLQEHAKKLGRGLWKDAQFIPLPQKAGVRDSRGLIPASRCARESGCVWVSKGDASTEIGIWEAKPGKKCSCAGG